MAQKIVPTAKQKSTFYLHLVIYVIAFIAMWSLYKGKSQGWVYPWPAWITAAWGLALIGHWCALWTSYEDKGMDEYNKQVQNG